MLTRIGRWGESGFMDRAYSPWFFGVVRRGALPLAGIGRAFGPRPSLWSSTFCLYSNGETFYEAFSVDWCVGIKWLVYESFLCCWIAHYGNVSC